MICNNTFIVWETEVHTCTLQEPYSIRNSKIYVWQDPKRCFKQGPNQPGPVCSRKVRTTSTETYWNCEPHELMCHLGNLQGHRNSASLTGFCIGTNARRIWSSSIRSTLEQRRQASVGVYATEWFLQTKSLALERKEKKQICHAKAEHGNKWSVQSMFEQNHESKKSKQNLGMPEDNLKSIVQAFFLLTREMLCKRFDWPLSILIPDVRMFQMLAFSRQGHSFVPVLIHVRSHNLMITGKQCFVLVRHKHLHWHLKTCLRQISSSQVNLYEWATLSNNQGAQKSYTVPTI